jgi:hypothetical protein
MHRDIHSSSGFRTPDPSVRADEDGSCLRPRGHCDRPPMNSVDIRAGIAQSVRRPTMDWTVRVRFPARASDSSLPHSVQNDSGAHPASYSMGTGGCFPAGKADHSHPSSAEVNFGGAILPLRNTPSWCHA